MGGHDAGLDRRGEPMQADQLVDHDERVGRSSRRPIISLLSRNQMLDAFADL